MNFESIMGYPLSQLFESEDQILPGTVVFHGTQKSRLPGILRNGLEPREERWSNKYSPNGTHFKGVTALFVSTNFETAKDFALHVGGFNGLSKDPIVLSFAINSTDIVKGAIYIEDELTIFNRITPDRLKIVYGNDNINQIQDKVTKVDILRNKLKEINKILSSYKIRVVSKSKTTERLDLAIKDKGLINWWVEALGRTFMPDELIVALSLATLSTNGSKRKIEIPNIVLSKINEKLKG